ncbi:helix-turn-helix transcriptional regulator [Apilactobacillus timberlakei]|uniref:XRE family transcriptional regulator n=1 Tax=Apilactobacillus timberlakei TaxID=2008380 RepID=A0ABY2YR61_9LACO|nr:helix-turn-helix transcriptional regulator [Apilactobacillus timberlakei]TPR12211.1 XRE family transcriptional regulator [Apilactobacillus timberlakei]TPR12496.1 XRE family transcriptional regulator [Apilactobacillus timberlakei]
MKLSKELKKQRKYKGFTQEYVANYLHVSRKTISSWENDHGLPNKEYLDSINELYGTKIKFISKDNKKNNLLFKKLYYANLIVFFVSIFSLITGLLKIITILQLILVTFIIINYSNKIDYNNKIKLLLFFLLVLLVNFVIIMRNLFMDNTFYGNLSDLPYYMGGLIHSLVITLSFFIITIGQKKIYK